MQSSIIIATLYTHTKDPFARGPVADQKVGSDFDDRLPIGIFRSFVPLGIGLRSGTIGFLYPIVPDRIPIGTYDRQIKR